MPSHNVEALPAVADTLGEAPFWDSATQQLYSVSICDGKVHVYQPSTRQHRAVQVGSQGDCVGFVIPCERGSFLAGLNRRIVHFDLEAVQSSLRSLHEVEDGLPTRFNDAKCDPAGRLLAGTMGLESGPGQTTLQVSDACSLYGMADVGSLKTLDVGFSLSNGMAWSGSKFFFIESVSRRIYAYDWDADGFSIANRSVAVDFKLSFPEVGMPDGMTIDANGHLWVACYFGHRVLRIDPEVGRIVDEVKLPASNITSCCFGGPNMDELYVTSSRWGVEDQPLAGSLFKVTGLGVKGTPSVAFKGAV